MGFSERLRSEMQRQGISQNKLAHMAQISQSGLSSIMRGYSSPKEDTLRRLSEALGCSMSWLVGGDGDTTMSDLTQEERHLIAQYRQLNRHGKDFICQALNMAVITYPAGDTGISDLENAQ